MTMKTHNRLTLLLAFVFVTMGTFDAIAQDIVIAPPTAGDFTAVHAPDVVAPTPVSIDPTRVGGWGSLAALLVVLLGQVLKSPALGGWLNSQSPLIKRLVLAALALACGALTSWLGGLAWREALSTAALAVVSSTWLWEQTSPVVDAVKAHRERASQPAPEPPAA